MKSHPGHLGKWRREIVLATTAALALAGAAFGGEEPQSSTKVVKEGISLELSLQPLGTPGPLMEGQDVRVTLTIADQATGSPLTGLYPGAWMDGVRAPGKAGSEPPAECGQKVASFIGGSLLSRPVLDLNVYYVLALNEDATISVVDPLFGYGSSKLLTMVFLKSPGEDWALTKDGGRLFVSMPDSDRVAVVDTASWKVLAEVATGPRPRRVGLQPDGQYLWAAHDSGVSVLDAQDLRKVADIPAGAGGHDLAFSDDSRFAFITNEAGGTVSVIDVAKLARLRDVPVGDRPVSIAWSAQAQAAYISTAGAGAVVAVDGRSPQPLARIASTPGLGQIRFAPGGRLAFVVHPDRNTVHIIDAASNRLVQTADVEDGPDQVAFSDELAYVRHRGSETVLMIPLKAVGEPGKPVPVIDFPGGQHPPGRMEKATPADGIVPSPGDNAVLVANPEDEVIYFYKEGMAAPMGHFRNYGRQPRAVQVVNRSLREVRPGVYQTTAKMTAAGDYELALFLDSPRLVHCFPVKLAENPALAAARKPPLDIKPVLAKTTVGVGEEVPLRFKLAAAGGGPLKTGLGDVRVLTFLSPGIWQQRQLASEVEEGVYEVRFQPPREGIYFAFIEVPSAGIPYQKSPFVVLTASEGKESLP